MVLVQSTASRLTVAFACGLSASAGVKPGMTLAEARAICSGLIRFDHDAAEDAKSLHRLAQWMIRFSPAVAVEGTDAILLDVTGSERLFGGFERLTRLVVTGLTGLGFSVHVATAPTLGAAWAIASFGESGTIISQQEIRTSLDPLPIAALRLGDEVIAALQSLGIRRVDQLLNLPRRALPARFGSSVLTRLDQAMGLVDEPLVLVRRRQQVRAALEFETSIESLEMLWEALKRLITSVGTELRQQCRGAKRLALDLAVSKDQVIRKEIHLSRASVSSSVLFNLLRCSSETVNSDTGFIALTLTVLASEPLTCIAKSIQFINDTRAAGETPLHMHTIPAEDAVVYDMVSDADTVGVFQIESRAQMSMLPRLRPKEFYDLVIEVAIVRPGPIQGDMVHPYLRRRQGLEKVEYPQEGLRTVLGKTLGVPLFQEQAMRIAIECAGFSPEEADRLRRAVTGFRRYGDIETFAQKFVGGMLDRGYEKEFAERCFAQLRGFASYGFPESHAASFALLVYVSSWIKRHHPAAFCAGLLNSQPMGFYAPAQIVRDAQLHGVAVLPVDVNFSDWDCTLAPPAEVSGGDVTPKWNWGKGGPSVRLGLRMVRGLRAQHAERIVSARRTCGVFRSFSHFARTTGLPSHTMLRLAEADAFGSFGVSRREALWEVMAYEDEPMPLFESLDEDRSDEVHLPVMPAAEEVATDYQTAGLSLKRHPVALIRDELARMRIIPAATLAHMTAGRWVKVAGIVLIRQRPRTASGIVFETLEDETGVVNLIIKPNVYDRHRNAARHAVFAQADGYVERQGQVVHVMVMRMRDLTPLLRGCETTSRDFH